MTIRIQTWIAVVFTAACGGSTASVDSGTATDAGVDAAIEAPPPGDGLAWHNAGRLAHARYDHTATKLVDGTVIVAGGEDFSGRSISAVERFDPETDTWTTVAEAPESLRNHTASRLPSGDVLFVGGGTLTERYYPSGDVTAKAWILHANTWEFEETGSLATARSHHEAVTLEDGRILIVGGAGSSHSTTSMYADALREAELYDPEAGEFASAGAMETARYYHAATRLEDGRVIVVGGTSEHELSFVSSEVFDPQTGTWSAGPSLTGDDRLRHAFATLSDGRVLVAGGKKSNVRFLSSAEVFDGTAWAPVDDLERAGNEATLTATRDGYALFIGGFGQFAVDEDYEHQRAVQRFSPDGTWAQLATLVTARTAHTTTALDDGSLLVVGGHGRNGAHKTCERSTPL